MDDPRRFCFLRFICILLSWLFLFIQIQWNQYLPFTIFEKTIFLCLFSDQILTWHLFESNTRRHTWSNPINYFWHFFNTFFRRSNNHEISTLFSVQVIWRCEPQTHSDITLQRYSYEKNWKICHQNVSRTHTGRGGRGGRLLRSCGTGLSFPTGLPNEKKLTIIVNFDYPTNSAIF